MSVSTPLLLETIRCEGGEAHNLIYHQQRFDKSRKALFGSTHAIELSQIVRPPQKGLYRCRVLYDEAVREVQYIPYTPKEIITLKVLSSDISYPYKYADRSELDALLRAHEDADEIIIVQKGRVTDTTISNIAFSNGEKWFTPSKPLLQGTMREKLIDEGFLSPVDIFVEEIYRYKQVALMNAMIGFKIINPVILTDFIDQ